MLWLIEPIRKFQRKWFVLNRVPGAVFTTLPFLCNIWVDPISYSFYYWQALPVTCNVKLWLIEPIRKFQIKRSVVNRVPGAVFTTLRACYWQALPVKCNVESGLSHPFASFKENEVLWIWGQMYNFESCLYSMHCLDWSKIVGTSSLGT